MQQLNGVLYKACKDYGYNFVDIGAVPKSDLWTDGINLLKSGITAIAMNLKSSFRRF